MYQKKSVCSILSLLLVLVMTFSFVGCSKQTETTSSASDAELSAAEDSSAEGTSAETADTITIVDHLDNTVTLTTDVQRIVVCDPYPLPSVLAILFDSAEKIVGMPPASMSPAQNGLLGQLYPELLNAETGFVNDTDVNVEEVVALNPDVVFYSADNPSLGESLTNAGLSAVAISASKWDYDAIETLKQWVSLLGQIFPENDKTDIVSSYSDTIYNLVQERVSGLSDEEKAEVFFLFKYTDSMIATSGNSFFGQWWADAIGAKNVAEELEVNNAAPVNMEQIYAWNPEIIFITNFNTAQPADLIGNTIGNYDWSSIAAVENGRVYKMPLGMYRSYTAGIDTPVTLLWLAKTTYPELFEDIDITAQTIQYYEEVFGITLTEDQANMIFAPASDAAGGIN
jgi:iron complex transport system substrate-binding protein